MTGKISSEQIKNLLISLCQIFQKEDIPYLIYGSTEVVLLTDNNFDKVNDIDVITKQSDFDRLSNFLKEPSLKLNPITTSDTIHANSLIYSGNNGQPFDISFDSYEHYFEHLDVNLNEYQEKIIDGVHIKIMPLKKLVQIYETYRAEKDDGKIELLKFLININ
jgi:hypothetical protein